MYARGVADQIGGTLPPVNTNTYTHTHMGVVCPLRDVLQSMTIGSLFRVMLTETRKVLEMRGTTISSPHEIISCPGICVVCFVLHEADWSDVNSEFLIWGSDIHGCHIGNGQA